MGANELEPRRELPVCATCGWHVVYGHESDCSVEKAAAADDLVKRVTRSADAIKATKLGYGYGRVSFEFSDTTTITFDVHKDGTFRLFRLYLIGEMPTVDALALVDAIHRWVVG